MGYSVIGHISRILFIADYCSCFELFSTECLGETKRAPAPESCPLRATATQASNYVNVGKKLLHKGMKSQLNILVFIAESLRMRNMSLPHVYVSTAWCNEIGSLTSLMHGTQVHPVTTENQFHCTRLHI